MTIVRALQKEWIAHSRWALALQQAGLMFVTTRIFSPIYLYLGFSTGDSYHMGVWSAGFCALFGFCYLERNRQEVIRKLVDSEKLQQTNIESAFFHRQYSRILFWLLFALIFVGAPLLRFTNLLDDYVDVNTWLAIQGTLLLSFYFIVMYMNIFIPKETSDNGINIQKKKE